jgi:hypothetical protein
VIGAAGPEGITAEVPFFVTRIMRDGSTGLFATGVYVDNCATRTGSPVR